MVPTPATRLTVQAWTVADSYSGQPLSSQTVSGAWPSEIAGVDQAFEDGWMLLIIIYGEYRLYRILCASARQ